MNWIKPIGISVLILVAIFALLNPSIELDQKYLTVETRPLDMRWKLAPVFKLDYLRFWSRVYVGE